MLNATSQTLREFVDAKAADGAYRLSDVTLDIPNARTAVFRARLEGPAGSRAWARAWLWSEAEKTVAETASEGVNCGEYVTLTVRLQRDASPDHASMRIESSPLRTEHVVQIKLP